MVNTWLKHTFQWPHDANSSSSSSVQNLDPNRALVEPHLSHFRAQPQRPHGATTDLKKKDSNWSGSILKWIQIQTAIWNDFRSHSFLVLHSQAQLEDLRVSIFWVRNLFPNHQDSRCWGHILFLKEQIEQIPLFSVNQLLYQFWGPLTCLVTCPKI